MRHVNLHLLLDNSGSMSATQADTIGGINAFVAEQLKNTDTTLAISLSDFSGYNRVVRPLRAAQHWTPLTTAEHTANGPSTALLDAMGDTFFRLALVDDPAVLNILVVITDGAENASTRYAKAGIAAKTAEFQSRGWQVVYIGANQDAWSVGSQYGAQRGQTLNWTQTSIGTYEMYGTLAQSVSSYRSAVSHAVDEEALRSVSLTVDPAVTTTVLDNTKPVNDQ